MKSTSKRSFGGSVDMTKGNEISLLLKFTLPLLIGNIFQQFYNMVDSIVVGKYVNSPNKWYCNELRRCFPFKTYSHLNEHTKGNLRIRSYLYDYL